MLMRIDFDVYCCNSDNELIEGTKSEKTVLFNNDTISIEEVNKLIENNMIEFSSKVLYISKEQADNLQGKGFNILNMYSYHIYESEKDLDYETCGYIFASDENGAKTLIQDNFPKKFIVIDLEKEKIKNGTILYGVRLD